MLDDVMYPSITTIPIDNNNVPFSIPVFYKNKNGIYSAVNA